MLVCFLASLSDIQTTQLFIFMFSHIPNTRERENWNSLYRLLSVSKKNKIWSNYSHSCCTYPIRSTISEIGDQIMFALKVGFVHSVKKEKGKKKKGYSVVFLKQSNEHCLISMVETSRLSIVSLPESFFQEKFTSPSSSYLSFYTWIIVGGWTVSLAFRSWSVWSYIRLSSLGWFVLAFLVVYFGGVGFGFVLGLLFCFVFKYNIRKWKYKLFCVIAEHHWCTNLKTWCCGGHLVVSIIELG